MSTTAAAATAVETTSEEWRRRIAENDQAIAVVRDRMKSLEAERSSLLVSYPGTPGQRSTRAPLAKIRTALEDVRRDLQERSDLRPYLEHEFAHAERREGLAAREEKRAELYELLEARVQLGGAIDRKADKLVPDLERFLELGTQMQQLASDLELGGNWLGKRELLGFFLYRIGGLFPNSLPRAHSFHRRPLLDIEADFLTSTLHVDDPHEELGADDVVEVDPELEAAVRAGEPG